MAQNGQDPVFPEDFDFDQLESFSNQISLGFEQEAGPRNPKFDVHQLEVFNKPIPVDFQAINDPKKEVDYDPFGSILDALDNIIGDDTIHAPQPIQEEPVQEEEENPTINPGDWNEEYSVFATGPTSHDSDYAYFNSEPITIDDDVFIFLDAMYNSTLPSSAYIQFPAYESFSHIQPDISPYSSNDHLLKPDETETETPISQTSIEAEDPNSKPPEEDPTEVPQVNIVDAPKHHHHHHQASESGEKEGGSPQPIRWSDSKPAINSELPRNRSVNVLTKRGSTGASSAPRPNRPSNSPLSQSHPPTAKRERRTSRSSSKNPDRPSTGTPPVPMTLSSSPGTAPSPLSTSPGSSGHHVAIVTPTGSTSSDDEGRLTRLNSGTVKNTLASRRIIANKDKDAAGSGGSDALSKNFRQSFVADASLIFGHVLPAGTESLLWENLKLFRIAEEAPYPHVKCQLYWRENYYKTRFFSEVHLNYYGTKDSKEFSVVSVLKRPTKLGYEAVKTDKRGSFMFKIPTSAVEVKKTVPLPLALETYLSSPAYDEGLTYTYIDEPDFGYGLINLEEKHRQNPFAFKVAVLYSIGTETTLQDFFNHREASDSFWKWLNLIGRKIELNGWKRYRGDFVVSNTTQQSYYKEFGNIEIMYHICLWMDAEQHRRLIGNDVVFFVFHNSRVPFDPSGLDGLGTVPQVFFVIQEIDGEYRASVFTRPNIKEFEPPLPMNTTFKPEDFVKVLLTKAFNGFCTAVSCPPMNRLFEVPRREAITSLIETTKQNKTRVPLKEIKERKEILKSIEVSSSTQILISVLKARDLPAMDANGQSDPFCKIKIANQTQKTKPKYKTLAPEWNEQLVFSSYFVDPTHTICLEIWDWNQIFEAVFMCSLEISLKTFCSNLESPHWYPLYGESNTFEDKKGEILLKFELVGDGKSICPACHIFIGSMDAINYSTCSYHAACVKCQECYAPLVGPQRKRLKRDRQQKRDVFFCDKHWDAHEFTPLQLDEEGGTIEYHANFKNRNKPPPKK